jgi:hypothetical protein
MAVAMILVALIVSLGVLAAILYSYSETPHETPVTITQVPVPAATIGTPIEISANVTGPGRNVTLVYGQTASGLFTQVMMNPVSTGEYRYQIPANQVGGEIAYYIKAYDPIGREVNTTVYHISVADFGLQPQTHTLTVYRTKSAIMQLQPVAVNNFDGQLKLSTSGNPSGLAASFSSNPVGPGENVVLNFTAAANTPNGTYPVTITATYSPPQSSQVTRQTIVDVTVTDFQIAVTPASNTIHVGSTAAFTITLTLQKGFIDPVSITSVSGLPQGASYTLTVSNPTVLAGTTAITLQVKIPSLAKTGTYTIVILASGGGVVHSLTAQIIVR